MKVFEEDLVLDEDTTFDEGINVKGRIKAGYNSLEVRGKIDAGNIDARDIDALNIDAWKIDARDIDALNIDAWKIDARYIDAWNIDAGNIDAGNISFYAYCVAYYSIKCRSVEGRRENSFYKVLDGSVEFKGDEE